MSRTGEMGVLFAVLDARKEILKYLFVSGFPAPGAKLEFS
jgi:hypothetical protein